MTNVKIKKSERYVYLNSVLDLWENVSVDREGRHFVFVPAEGTRQFLVGKVFGRLDEHHADTLFARPRCPATAVHVVLQNVAINVKLPTYNLHNIQCVNSWGLDKDFGFSKTFGSRV